MPYWNAWYWALARCMQRQIQRQPSLSMESQLSWWKKAPLVLQLVPNWTNLAWEDQILVNLSSLTVKSQVSDLWSDCLTSTFYVSAFDGDVSFMIICFVESQVLGAVNKGTYVLFTGLDVERTVLAAGPVGWAYSLHPTLRCKIISMVFESFTYISCIG